MFAIMNSVIRLATRIESTEETARRPDWPQRAAIERSQSLRLEGCAAPESCPAKP